MSKFICNLGMVLVFAVVGTLAEAVAVKVGEGFPAIEFKHFQAGKLDDASRLGKVTIVNFWATWCESCKVEIKEMEEKFATFFINKNVNIAFVSLDKKPEKAVKWFNDNLKNPKKLLTYLYADTSFKSAETLDLDTFPMTFVIDKDGKVALIQHGYKEGDPSTERIVKKVQGLL